MKVRIYSSHCSRSDYILFQYNSIKKHVKDEWEYIVFNDGMNTATTNNFMNNKCRDDITSMCEALKVECVPIPPETHTQRDQLFPTGALRFAQNYSHRSADACQVMLKHSIPFDGIVVMMDSDMFFCEDFSFEEYIKDYNLAFLPQERKPGVVYMWNNLVIYKPKELPDLYHMSFDSGTIQGHAMDAGAMTYYYLEKYKPYLKIRTIQFVERPLEISSPLGSLDQYEIPCPCPMTELCFQPEIVTNPPFRWQILEKGIFHYGQGGNWNAKSYDDHLVKTKTMLTGLQESLLTRKG